MVRRALPKRCPKVGLEKGKVLAIVRPHRFTTGIGAQPQRKVKIRVQRLTDAHGRGRPRHQGDRIARAENLDGALARDEAGGSFAQRILAARTTASSAAPYLPVGWRGPATLGEGAFRAGQLRGPSDSADALDDGTSRALWTLDENVFHEVQQVVWPSRRARISFPHGPRLQTVVVFTSARQGALEGDRWRSAGVTPRRLPSSSGLGLDPIGRMHPTRISHNASNLRHRGALGGRLAAGSPEAQATLVDLPMARDGVPAAVQLRGRRGAHGGRRIPSFFSLLWRVVGLSPSAAAAPFGP